MLADQVDYVIGIDTHRDTHAVAVCNPAGGLLAEITIAADVFGYRLRRDTSGLPERCYMFPEAFRTCLGVGVPGVLPALPLLGGREGWPHRAAVRTCREESGRAAWCTER